MNFAEMLKASRIKRRQTLRDCAEGLRVDASNWSKLERGVLPAPKDPNILEAWADFLDLGDAERQTFLDLAALSRGQIPPDLASNDAVMARLPAFFRVVRGRELEGEKLAEFVEDIRKIHRPGTANDK